MIDDDSTQDSPEGVYPIPEGVHLAVWVPSENTVSIYCGHGKPYSPSPEQARYNLALVEYFTTTGALKNVQVRMW
jgi:hypothetical protein